MSCNFLKKKIFSSWNVAFFLSISLHTALFLLSYQLFFNDPQKKASLLEKWLPVKENQSLFLVDLESPRYDLNEEKRVIALYDYQGWGRLYKSELEEQHVIGKFNPQASDTSYNAEFFTPFTPLEKPIAPQEEVRQDELSKSGIKEKKIEEQNKKSLSSDNSSKLAIETKNSYDVNFWYDENNRLQVSTFSDDNSKFLTELMRILARRFTLYIQSGGALNYALVRPDLVRSLAFVDRGGLLNFEKTVVHSSGQPYFNYVSKGITGPIKIENLPPAFLASEEDKVYFFITVEFLKFPLKRWRMNLSFPQEFF